MLVAVAFALLLGAAESRCVAEEAQATTAAPTIEKGQRIFSAGHSFHMFVPGILRELAVAAGIEEHVQVGSQGIGGSYMFQHWDRPDDMNTAKQALETGQVDVFTMSPIYLPDDGIENFARLALEKNPDVRVMVQEFWLPFDVFNKDYKKRRPEPADRNSSTAEETRSRHEPYFQEMDEHVRQLNEKLGKPFIYVVPTGQAVILLREKIIAGEAPGLKEQNDLFTDAIGHGTAPLQALVAYCHYGVIYRRSPLGLPIPAVLKDAKHPEWDEQLNQLLQELAWQAVQQHSLSGVAP